MFSHAHLSSLSLSPDNSNTLLFVEMHNLPVSLRALFSPPSLPSLLSLALPSLLSLALPWELMPAGAAAAGASSSSISAAEERKCEAESAKSGGNLAGDGARKEEKGEKNASFQMHSLAF
jgi:hypothetical protein